MRVLVTGAFGNIGRSVVALLCRDGHAVRCFDRDSKANQRHLRLEAARWEGRKAVEVLWGDVTRAEETVGAMAGVEAVIHLAGIIPPLSERQPELARRVNVDGTRNLIEAAGRQRVAPRFVFASSVSVYGPRMGDPPPRRADEPPRPTDHYTHHKVECEGMLRESDLPWTILRIAAVLVPDVMRSLDPILFEIPLNQRIELIHVEDTARACARAVVSPEATHRTLLIGGGERAQMHQREFLQRVLRAAGLGMLPESAFLVPRAEEEWFYTDYMDTAEAQRLLHYQALGFDDYLEDLRQRLGPLRRGLARLFRPAILFALAFASPYYRRHLRAKVSWGHPPSV